MENIKKIHFMYKQRHESYLDRSFSRTIENKFIGPPIILHSLYWQIFLSYSGKVVWTCEKFI